MTGCLLEKTEGRKQKAESLSGGTYKDLLAWMAVQTGLSGRINEDFSTIADRPNGQREEYINHLRSFLIANSTPQ